MDRHRHSTALIICAIIWGILLFVCLMLIITGVANPTIPSFAVDQSGKLYIATTRRIEVYDNGTLVKSISPRTSRAYQFTIQPNNTILIATPTKVYNMDLDGTVLSSYEEKNADTYNQLSYRRKQFNSPNGDTYEMRGILGWTKIIKNDADMVYSISLISFAVKTIFALTPICFVFFLYIYKKNGYFLT